MTGKKSQGAVYDFKIMEQKKIFQNFKMAMEGIFPKK